MTRTTRPRRPALEQLEARGLLSGVDFGGVHVWTGDNFTATAGVAVLRHGRFVVPNPTDNIVATVDYDLGHGAPRQPLALDFTTNTFALSHTYTRPGVYVLYVQILDYTAPGFGLANSLDLVTVRRVKAQ
jgi:hypothetical protein